MKIFNFFWLLLLIVQIVPSLNGVLFSNTPIIDAPFTQGNANLLKVAPDQSMIVVGFGSSNLYGFNMQGASVMQFSLGNYSQVSDIDWILGVGPLALGSNTLYLWYANGTAAATQSLTSNSNAMSVTYLATLAYVAVGLGSSYVMEYLYISNGFLFNKYYYSPNGMQINNFEYGPGYQTMIAALCTSLSSSSCTQVAVYSCATGNMIGSPYTFPDGSGAQSLVATTYGYIVMTTSNTIYSISVQGSSITGQVLGATPGYDRYLAYCPGTNYIAVSTGVAGLTLFIYDQYMNQLQQPTYATYSFNGLACTYNYLVAITSNNYLIIDTYDASTMVDLGGGIAGWVVAIIVIAVLGVVGCFAAIGVIIVMKSKKNGGFNGKDGGNNMTGKELLIPQPNSQANRQNTTIYGNQSGIAVQNNQYPNQFKPNQQPQMMNQYPNQYQNYPNQYQQQYQNKPYMLQQNQRISQPLNQPMNLMKNPDFHNPNSLSNHQPPSQANNQNMQLKVQFNDPTHQIHLSNQMSQASHSLTPTINLGVRTEPQELKVQTAVPNIPSPGFSVEIEVKEP